jgi:hypothetical protein
MTISNYLEQNWLQTIRGGGVGTSYTAPAGVFLQLHTADPLDAGTTAVAGNNVRQAATFAAAANPAGTMATSATVTWTSVSTAETYTHWSLWDLSSAGNCLWTGALSASATVAVGDTFQITALTLTLD